MAQRLRTFLKQHGLAVLFLFCILLGCGASVFAASTFRLDHTRIVANSLSDFSEGWVWEDSENSFPQKPFTKKKTLFLTGSAVLTAELSASDTKNGVICLFFRTKNLKIRLYADDILSFEYGYHQSSSFGKSFGSIENLVDLNISNDTILRLELSPQDPNAPGTISAPQLGSHDSVILSLFQKKALSILICALLLLIAAGLLIASTVRAIRHLPFASFFALGCGVLLVAVWLATETLLLQFLSDNKAVSYILANLTFLLLPVPFLLLLKQACPEYSKILSLGEWIQCLYAFFRLICYIFDVLDFNEAEEISHLPLLFNLILALIIYWRERHNRAVKNMLYATIVLCISAAFSLSSYWSGYSYYPNIVFVGILLFILVLVLEMTRRAFAMQKKVVRAEFYKRCAYTDWMTELGNRASFEQKLTDLKQEPCTIVTFFLFDLNNLKETNDSFGHSEGDHLICRLADCLHTAFDSCAKTYRIGGDEFVTVFTGLSRKETSACLSFFHSLLEQNNQQNAVPLSVAIGCASNSEPDFIGTVDDLLQLADTRMYHDKQSAETAASISNTSSLL